MEETCSRRAMMFFADQDRCSADILPPSEVRARIELAVLHFLKSLMATSPTISDLPLVSRSSGNSRRSQGLLTDISSLFLSHAVCTRSFMRPNAAKAFIRVWKVIEVCLQILAQGKRVTQRELFYMLLCDSPDYFSCQLQVNKTIQDVVALLRCSRYSLGIMASSRGVVVGRLKLQEPGKDPVDCSGCGSSGFGISGDLDLVDGLIMTTDARYILLVEKHAVFQRLAEDRIFNQIPSIIITAKGYPDIATRNPAGLAILCTFKYGSLGMGLEAYRYACNVKWLGLRGDDLPFIPEEALLPLKPRDFQVAKSLTSSKTIQDEFRQELEIMLQSGKRAEIEALYIHGYDFLSKYLANKIVKGGYI
uniref:DNA topoisomerase (ATP-hydrolyzing) n=2 Tax=Kalanchoe fedtschenkoi TaxID=63787 RepID=A0A7N0TVJ6_KALFE